MAGLATIVQLGLMARVVHLVLVQDVVQLNELRGLFTGLLLAIALRALFQALQGICGAAAAKSVRQQVDAAILI